MKQRKRWAIEVAVAGIVLALLLLLTLPPFFRAQRSRNLIRIFEDMDRVMCAIAHYIQDHARKTPGAPTPALQGFYIWGGGYYSESDLPQFLCDQGYLDRVPDFSYRNAPANSCAVKVTIPERRDRAIFMTMYWPFVSEANHKRYVEDFFEGNHAPMPPSREYLSGMALHPLLVPDHRSLSDAYYAPSNGMDSAGFVCLDMDGNHSPFGREAPRLGVLELKWE
ncbi:MAG: hypothetical protein JXR73_14075 [Candidatus Omnitrophica bacterium]|nr:hypothetical protein [Candidatus Omnitrophota bacterium]